MARIVLISLVLAASPIRAQETETAPPPSAVERAGITGSIRAGYWSSTRNLDPERHLGAGMLWIQATRQISDRVSFLAEGWTALRGPIGDADATGEVHEAFVDVQLGRLDLRLGRQIIAWGRADGLNPTDNLTAEDLTLLAPEDDDRRLGTTAARATYYVGGVSLTGLWLPEFRAHRFALPPPPPGLTFVQDGQVWPANQWAVRVEQTGRAVDWSLSYFRGLDLSPDLGLQQIRDGSGSVRLSHHRVRIVGGDLAANAGRSGLRAEAAYVDTEDSTGGDPYTKNPFVFLVLGGDRTFLTKLNVNVQYLSRFAIDHQPLHEGGSVLEAAVAAQQAILNSQAQRVQHGASFRIAYKWFHDTLEAESPSTAQSRMKAAVLARRPLYRPLSGRPRPIRDASDCRCRAAAAWRRAQRSGVPTDTRVDSCLPSASELKSHWCEVNGRLLAGFDNFTASDWAQKHLAVSEEDFAANPLRNRLSVLLSRTNHLAYHLGQTALAPKSSNLS